MSARACVPTPARLFADNVALVPYLLPDPQAERPGERAISEAGFDALLVALPERWQGLLTSVYRDGRPLSAVAEERNVSLAAASSQHRAALRRLRSQVPANPADCP